MDMSKTEVMATAGAVEIPAARIDQGLERLTHSLKLLRAEGPDRDWAIAALPHLTTPADGGKLAVLCAALLEPYYSRDTNKIAKQLEAEMWVEALSVFPFWAVRKAVAWWQSAANASRRKRPIFGDIEEKAQEFMAPINAARIYLSMSITGTAGGEPEDLGPPMSDEELAERRAAADEILRGFMDRTASPAKGVTS